MRTFLRTILNTENQQIISGFLFIHGVVWVWCLVGGAFFWAGYSLIDAIVFAIITTLYSAIFSAPAFGLLDREGYDSIAAGYLLIGAAIGMILVFSCGGAGFVSRILSPGPEEQLLSPFTAASLVGAISVIPSLLAATFMLLSRPSVPAN